MKISKRTRESAALACQIAASNQTASINSACAIVDRRPIVSRLAYSAFGVAVSRCGMDYIEASYAEAEAMLRTGWAPS